MTTRTSTGKHAYDPVDEYKGGIIRVGHWAGRSKQFTAEEVRIFSELSTDKVLLHLSPSS